MVEMSLLVLTPQNRKKKTKKEVAQIWMSEKGKALQYSTWIQPKWACRVFLKMQCYTTCTSTPAMRSMIFIIAFYEHVSVSYLKAVYNIFNWSILF